MSTNSTDIFGIDELVTESGVLGEYKTSAEIRVRFVVENAQSSNQFSIYGRIRGQTAWEAAGSFTGNATTDITVAQYDFIMVICDVFASDSNNVHFLASGIAQSSTGISSITAGGHSLVGLDNITLTSDDSSVTLTSSTQTGVIDLSVSGISGLNTTVGHLNTLSGVAANADNLGTFTGTIVPDNTTIKNAIQSLETSIDALPDPMEYKGLWSATTNTPTLTDGTGNNGDVYQVTAGGSVNFGHGAIVFAVADKCVYNGATARYEKWYMNDAVSSVNGYTGAVSLVKADVGLGNADNTSDVNKPVSSATTTQLNLKANIASPTFTGTVGGITASMVGLDNVDNTSDLNKPVSTATSTALAGKQATGNYITALIGDVTAFGPGSSAATIANSAVIAKVLTGYTAGAGTVSATDSILTAIQKIDANTTAVASTAHNGLSGLQGGNSTERYHLTAAQATIATQAATASVSGYLTSIDWSTFNNKASVILGDILPSSFNITNNQVAAANVTGFSFNSAAIRSFTAHVSVIINATTNKYETFNILGLQKNGSFDITIDGLGDNSGIVFGITSAGQITYTSTNNTGFTSGTIKFRALTTPV